MPTFAPHYQNYGGGGSNTHKEAKYGDQPGYTPEGI
jgi:hypothetical protein